MANLARSLADSGCTVLSFDYRGYGNSPGETEDIDVPGLERDIHDACGLLRTMGCERIALIGVRWGAALAERVASSREDVDALFLVQPVNAWRRTLMAALRSNVAGQYAIFKKAVMTREAIIKELLAGGDCVRSGYRLNNIEGYLFSRLFFEQSEAVSMPCGTGRRPGAIAVFDVREGKMPEDPECAALVAAYRAAGVSCESVEVTGDCRFWINNRIFTSLAPNLTREMGSRMAALKGDGAAEGALAAADKPGDAGIIDTIVNDGVRETAVRFSASSREMLYGVHYAPEAGRTRDVGIVFSHGGLIGMNGAFRFNTRAARRLAREGITSLCFDPHGMGRSPGTIGNIDHRQMFRKIQTGLFAADVDRAAAFFRERSGVSRIAVFGVCGGAITNLHAHARSRLIDCSMLLSIPVMLSGLAYGQVRMSEGLARFYFDLYARKLLNPRAWGRFFTFQSRYDRIFKALRLSLASAARPLLLKLGWGPATKEAAPAKTAPVAPALATGAEQAQERRSMSDTAGDTESGLQFNDMFLSSYRAVVSRRQRILFVFGDNDNFKWEYESAFIEKYPRDVSAGAGFVTTEIIHDANHMYTLREWQHEVLERCIRWLAAQERESGS